MCSPKVWDKFKERGELELREMGATMLYKECHFLENDWGERLTSHRSGIAIIRPYLHT